MHSKSPKVSVVIPTYNGMKYLPKTLASVLDQTFQDFEVLIVNDGSPDNVIEWASSICDSRVRLISQENQGIAIARNTGILNSKGEYIALLDHDDLWEATKLDKQLQVFESNPSLGLVSTWTIFFDDKDNSELSIDKTVYPTGDVSRIAILKQLIMSASCPMIHRKCFDAVGLFDPDLSGADDWDMWVRIAFKYPFGLVQEPLVRYRVHANNTSKDYKAMALRIDRAIEKVFSWIPPDLAWTKNRNYCGANLYIASIARSIGEYNQSIYYQLRAFKFSPRSCFNIEYFKTVLRDLAKLTHLKTN